MLPPFCLRSSRRRYCRAASFSSRRLLRRSSSSSALMRCAACERRSARQHTWQPCIFCIARLACATTAQDRAAISCSL